MKTENGLKEVVPISAVIPLSVLSDYIPKAPNLLFRQQSQLSWCTCILGTQGRSFIDYQVSCVSQSDAWK